MVENEDLLSVATLEIGTNKESSDLYHACLWLVLMLLC